VAFSSLAATPAWLERPEAIKFMRAYRQSRVWVRSASARDVAGKLQALFPGSAPAALVHGIEAYQRLGCWDGDPAIDPTGYEVALDVFQHAGSISRRYPYAQMVVRPPDAG
jgi:hypothetical protein